MGQGVLERVLALGKQGGLIEELRRLQALQAALQLLAGKGLDRLEQGERNVLADHRGGLKQGLVVRRKPVDARGEDGLDGRRDLDGVHRPFEAIGSALAREGSGLDQRPHALLQEERVSLRAPDEEPADLRHPRAATEEALQQLAGGPRRQRVEPDLLVVGFASPSVPVLRPIVHQQEQPGRGKALDEQIQPGLSLGIDPVQVLDHEQHRLHVALAQHEPLQGLQRPAPSLRGIELGPRGILDRHVEEREEHGEDRLERAVQ